MRTIKKPAFNLFGLLAIGGVAGSGIYAPLVQAQSAGLEEVVVSARKRTETSQEVPVSITAISQQAIERYDLTSLEKVAAATPQFYIGRASNGSGAQLTLRGIGSSSTSVGIEQSVAVIVDSIYYGQGRVINEGFFDLEGIEVLKGPQALFFGKNATAGVISLKTANPTPEFEAMTRLGYEFTARNVIGETTVSGPLTDALGARLALRASKMYGGYFKNRAGDSSYTTVDAVTGDATTHFAPAGERDVPGEETLMGRLTLQWAVNERLEANLKLSANEQKYDNSSWNYGAFECANGVSSLDGRTPCKRDFKIYQNDIPGTIAEYLPYSKNGELYNDYTSYGVTLALDYELDYLTITSATNYQYNRNAYTCDCDFQSVDTTGTWTAEKSTWDAWSTELRALSDFDSPVNFLAGAYYQNTRRVFNQSIAFAAAENSAAASNNRFSAISKKSETDGETVSAYGQLIWGATDAIEVTAGVRYTHETKDSYFLHPYVNPTLAGLFLADTRLADDQTFENWSPEATISWKPTPEITVYGAYKTAYKSGGFSGSGLIGSATVLDDVTFEPEKGKGFEAGVKTLLLDNTLRFNIGAYAYEYTNLQVDFFNSPTFAFITTNAGEAKVKGVELELEWASPQVAGLTLRGSLNYNKAEYANFLAPCYSGQTPAAGCSIVGPAPGFTPLQDLSGTPTAMAPEWSASAGVGYETEILDSLLLGLSLDARYSDDYLSSGFGNPLSRQPSYTMLDASVKLGSADGIWELALIGKNLTEEHVVTGVLDGPNTGGGTGTPAGFPADQIGQVGLPRTVLAQLTWRFH